jgi:hypothetical protein
MRHLVFALAATGLVACVDTGPTVQDIVVQEPDPMPLVDPVLPSAPEVRSSSLPPSGEPAPTNPVITSSAPISSSPDRSGCIITFEDGTRAVQRRTASGMQQTPADFLDAALVDGLEAC